MILRKTTRTRTRAQPFALSPADVEQLATFISLLHQVDRRINKQAEENVQENYLEVKDAAISSSAANSNLCDSSSSYL